MRILYVEDHADTLRVMVRLLTLSGYEVCGAASVAQAKQTCADQSFDIAILDIGLPDGDGRELLRELLTLSPNIKGIALSGYGSEEDVSKTLHEGFVAHLTKPIQLEQIKEAIEKLSQM